MTDIKAEDLPEGCVIADEQTRWVKRWQTPGGEWQSAQGSLTGDWYINYRLTQGAVVLGEGLS